MKTTHRFVAGALLGALAVLVVRAGLTRQELTNKLWPRSRILAALQAVNKLKAAGMMSPEHYRRKKSMLEARLNGTFHPAMLSITNPPLNFIQNAGFEDINRNSRPDRSRWLWWDGWSWGGNYENHWETRPQYVRSGKYSARIRCTGKKGRIGISTPKLPVMPGVREYEFTIWAKGEGNNELFINFEAGARGSFRGHIGPQWQQVHAKGTLDKGTDGYVVYIYVIGEGTIWLDDARLVPVGTNRENTSSNGRN